MSDLRNKERFITVLIFLFILALRIPHINSSPYEACELWRQSDTEAIARNFVEHRFNIFFPQLNYDGPLPNYSQLEFQITTFLIAILYKIFGYHYFLARLVPLLFFMGSVYFLFLIGKKFYGAKAAWLAILIYAILPLNLFFSRAIMPESAALLFFTGAFYFFSRWIDSEKFCYLIYSALFTAFAISQKVPTIFVGIPMIFMAAVKYKWKMFLKLDLWLFALLSLLPPLVYFKWLGTVAQFKFVNGIASKHILPDFYKAFFTPGAWKFFYIQIPKSFTWYVAILFVIGLFTADWKSKYPVGMWALAMMLELATIVAVIKFNYYLIFMSPPMALLAGRLLYLIWEKFPKIPFLPETHPKGRWKVETGPILVVVILMLIMVSGIRQAAPFYEQKEDILTQARIVDALTKKDDLIVTGTLDPGILNASHRQGWRANIKYYDFIPSKPKDEVKYYMDRGAKLFVPLKGSIYGDDGSYRKYLDEHFPKIEAIKGYPVYLLR